MQQCLFLTAKLNCHVYNFAVLTVENFIAIQGKEGDVHISDLLNQLNVWNSISLLKLRQVAEERKIIHTVSLIYS